MFHPCPVLGAAMYKSIYFNIYLLIYLLTYVYIINLSLSLSLYLYIYIYIYIYMHIYIYIFTRLTPHAADPPFLRLSHPEEGREERRDERSEALGKEETLGKIPRPFGARNEFTPWDCRRPKVHRELRSNEPD